MADIAMCPHLDCDLADRCYRSPQSGTPESTWQSWMNFGPVGLEECTGWWPVQDEQEEVTP